MEQRHNLRILVLVVASGPLFGQTPFTWQGGAGGTPYPWSNPANWVPPGPPDDNGELAIFPAGLMPPNNIVEVDSSFSIAVLTFDGATQYTLIPKVVGNSLTLTANPLFFPFARITVTGGNTHVINVPVAIDTLLGIIPTGSIVFMQPVSESVTGSGITIAAPSAGSATLAATNTYTGATIIQEGSLFLKGSLALSSGVSIANLGAGVPALFDISGITGTSTTIQDLASTGTGTNTINLGNKNLTFGTGNSKTSNANIIGIIGSLSKQGTGTFTMNGGTSTYGGLTNVLQGTFAAGAVNAFSPNSDVVLYDSATFDIGGFNNTIQSLSSSNPTVSSTIVTNSGSAATLTILNGGTFAGRMTNAIRLTLAGGHLTLLNSTNSYTGFTAVNPGSTLSVGNNSVLGTGTLFLDGTLQTLGNFSLSNAVTLSNLPIIDLQQYTMTLSGAISGAGTLTITSSPQGTLILSGMNTYSATTILGNGVTLQAGSVTALSINSDYILSGASTIDLNGFSNSVNSLSTPFTTSQAIVTNSGLANVILTISNGGNFGGRIVNGPAATTAITLNGGTLSLSSQNTYSGATIVNNSGILKADFVNAFSPNSSVTLNNSAILNLNGNNNTIAALSSASSTTQVTLSDATLTINGGATTTYAGKLVDALTPSCGSLTISGGTNLSLTGALNNYCGTTTIVNGNLTILATGALSPNSAIVVQSLGGLQQVVSTNSAPSLTTSGAVSQTLSSLTLGTLTMTGGTIVNSTSSSLLANIATISGGVFTNQSSSTFAGTGSNPTLSITGGVVANGTTCSTIPCTTTSAGCNGSDASQIGNATTAISFTGGLINSNSLIEALSYTQGAAATLNLIVCDPTFGRIHANGPVALNGTFVVSAGPLFPASPSTFYTLISNTAPMGVDTYTGQFSLIQLQGFAPTVHPRVIISPPRIGDGTNQSIATLFFSGCDATWFLPMNGNWDDNANWNPPCVPGITDPLETPIVTNDVARFGNVAASTITVTLAFEDQLAPLQLVPVSPVLYTMQFNATSTSYTINPFTTSKITFDAVSSLMPPAELLVDAGSHTINVPIVLNITTDLSLADGTQLTYGFGSTLQAGTALSSDLFVMQSLSSTLGTGVLLNNGTMSPTNFRLASATVLNNSTGIISPTALFSMQPLAGQNAHLINNGHVNPTGSLLFSGSGNILVDNSGVKANIGSSQPNSTLTLGGTGPIIVNNSGTAAIFGSSGNNGDFLVTASNAVTLNNTGSAAMMGPSGSGGQFIVSGSGPIALNNTGGAAKMVASGVGGNFVLNSGNIAAVNQGRDTTMGAIGTGGNFTMNGGTLQNSFGGIVRAGAGGLFTLAGGTITNNLNSQIGTQNHNILFTGGTIVNSGSILAFDYTQGAAANLDLNLTSVDIFGFIHAAGIANLNGTLTVTALPGFTAKSTDVLILIEGEQVLNQFSTINLLGFSGSLAPSVHYFPTTVELLFGSPITPSTGGTTGGTAINIALSSITEFNFLVEREMMNMHQQMYLRKKREQRPERNTCCPGKDELLFGAPKCVKTKKEQLAEKRDDRRCRVYVGPIASVGDLRGQSKQPGFEYDSVGVFGGIDRAGSDVGVGMAFDYQAGSGTIHDHLGHFNVDQLHFSAYGIWVIDARPEVSLGTIIGGGVDWYDFSRTTGPSKAPIVAKSDPSGHEFDVLVDFEYIFSHERYPRMPESIEFVPLAYIQYIRSSIDSFRETNAGAFNLSVGKQSRTSLRSFLGARLIQTVSSSTCTLRSEFDLGWQREYFDNDYEVRVRPFNLPSSIASELTVFGLNRNSFLGGIDLLLTVYDKFQVEGSYDIQWNPQWIDHSFYLGLGGKF